LLLNKNLIKKITLKIYLLILSLFCYSFAFSQLKTAEEYFATQNYKEALKLFLKDYEKKKNDIEINYKIAQCYLNANLGKKNAIPYLEFIVKQPKFVHETWLELGKAYHYNYQFEKAREAFNKFKEKAKGNDLNTVDWLIETTIHAEQITKNPLQVTFHNLGKHINSEYADYYPFCPSDESYVAFTTRRKSPGAVLEYDGLYSSDIFITEDINGEFQKAKSIGTMINTAENEECVGLTPNGKSMFIYIDHTEAVGDLYISHKDKKGFGATEPFSININSKYLESSGSTNENEDILVFASNRPGGKGGTDIYISRKLPGNEWSEPQNLGPIINSKYDEDFPQLTEDGKTLYFSSKGHYNMGGFDIFKSTFNTQTNTWSEPKNIGFPINTTEDDLHYAVSRSGHEAYISAVRDEGYGDLDIYRVIINSVEAPLTAVVTKLFMNDSATVINAGDVNITVIDRGTSKNYPGDFRFNPLKHNFVLALPSGHYRVILEAAGFEKTEYQLEVLDKKEFTTFSDKKVIMYQNGYAKPQQPNNLKQTPNKGVKPK
jgi:tetratricopeptide (TPR) repeat protein